MREMMPSAAATQRLIGALILIERRQIKFARGRRRAKCIHLRRPTSMHIHATIDYCDCDASELPGPHLESGDGAGVRVSQRFPISNQDGGSERMQSINCRGHIVSVASPSVSD